MACIYLSEISENKKVSFCFFWLGLAALGYPMAFRLPAVDDLSYQDIFNQANYYNLSSYFKASGVENGYLLLNWFFCRFIDNEYNHFQAFCAYITFVIWGIAFRRNSNHKGNIMFMVLFLWSHLYFFVLSAGLIRIFMSLSMSYIALQYIWKDQWKIFLLWIVLASFIHLSSLILLLFLFFYYKRKLFYDHWILFVFLTFFIVLFSLIGMAQFLVPILGDRYEGYGNVDAIDFSLGSFTTLPIWIACYYYYKTLSSVSVDYRKKYVIGMILISLSIIFSIASSAVHVGRIIFYAYLGLLIVISSIFQIRTRTISDMILKCLLIIYPIVYVMVTTLTNQSQSRLFPYQSFLTDSM